jgi:hypothetical protein
VRDIAADYTLCQENSPHFRGKGKEGGPSQREEGPAELCSDFTCEFLRKTGPPASTPTDYLNGSRHGESTNSSGPKINGRFTGSPGCEVTAILARGR